MKQYENEIFDDERSLYGEHNIIVHNCMFDGPKDGESALKECSIVSVSDSIFNLRYPFWHNEELIIDNCTMTEKCRAPLWYDENVRISNSTINGIKAIRECLNVEIEDSKINSPEFGWFTKYITLNNVEMVSEYFMMRAENLTCIGMEFSGKYSFQYVENARIERCYINTKDAFWHAKDVVIKDCVVKGEYLGWYSEGLTFINCTIDGTQPLCYCKNLKLINCEMKNADLCFERSEVEADIISSVISIKNPLEGEINVLHVDEVIRDIDEARAQINNLN